MKHGVGVAHGVFVGDDREGRKIGLGYAEFVHVAPHDHGIQGHKGCALRGLIVLIRSHGQARGGLRGQGIGHFLHPDHDDRINHAAGDGQYAYAHRGCARRTGRLDFGRLDAAQARKICDKGGQMLLAAEFARKHIAHIERISRFDARIRHGSLNRVMAQMAQGFIPQLAHGRLSNAYDCDVSHRKCPHCLAKIVSRKVAKAQKKK